MLCREGRIGIVLAICSSPRFVISISLRRRSSEDFWGLKIFYPQKFRTRHFKEMSLLKVSQRLRTVVSVIS